jgi:uncharacterized protein DUF664
MAPRTKTRPVLLRAIAAILDRDLRTLSREVEAYPDQRDLWREVPGISNVAGTLVLHLTGNLRHFFGPPLGRPGYVRDRPAEFARRDVPRGELLDEIAAARAAVQTALESPTKLNLDAVFPEIVGGSEVVTGEYLIHLVAHFAYHLGQVDYHRRVVTGRDVAVDAMRPAEMSSARPAR